MYYAAVFEVKNEIPIYLPQKAILDKHESGLATLPTARRIFLKHLCLYAGAFLLFVSAGCTQQQGSPPPTPEAKETSTSSSPSTSASPWRIQDPKINPLDGAKTQFLSAGSLEGKMEHHYISGLGDIPLYKSTAEIVVCFENGKLCGGTSIGARIDIDGFVSSDDRSVRLKYDDGQPIRQQWSRSDSHDSLFPSGREKQFLAGLLNHKRLYFEFSKYEEAPQVVTFVIEGLPDAMQKAGLKIPPTTSRSNVSSAAQDPARRVH